ncbi:MAG TPA: putative CRISPR-associated protein [Candidatus Thiothrix moscowensis]|uniref:putative CRISPR-associated protein n=1 Tax=unclassified Thiothrix TaxID=2636184 RepID=UPI0025F84C9C|nr:MULTISPECIES: putative CRISPR-associated protein [unclassified Thiothrix]HRJ53619.1 putative CRISPR-associated protein [Candidatus Thiothrix moscowensis]HRJ93700.1 putative CRISPR-associated protein [Candidatus Thiothrix moscowensis]
MANVIVSTCGTSILTNQTDDDLRKLLNHHANLQKPADCPNEVRQKIEDHIQQRQQQVMASSDVDLSRLSAEMNALLKFYDGRKNTQDVHILIHTDTWLGGQTGEIIKSVLEQRGFIVDRPSIRDLRTKDVSGFQLALSELVKWASETLPGYRQQKYHVVFNLTGGFKSIQGFMQTLAMLYADESIYVFETGNELLHLPRLPVRMEEEQVVRDHLMVLRQLALGFAVQNEAVAALPETFILRMDGELALSPWGELVWQEHKNKLYREQLYATPLASIHYTTTFLASVEGLSPDRYTLLNQQIDKLAQYLRSGHQDRLKSLDFKQLKLVRQGSTHEFDAWHDQNAKRVFCHYEGNILHLDRLDEGIGH